MRPQLILLIGIPGSGKSTFIDEKLGNIDAKIVSPDKIREQITGSVEDQSENEKVWKMIEITIEKALQNKESVILDSTLTEHDIRKNMLNLVESSAQKLLAFI